MSIVNRQSRWDVIVVGAGAAGMMAAIAAARQAGPDGTPPRVLLLDSQEKIGAKILVAGGGRCNVTNEFVDASRFNTDAKAPAPHRSFVARVLRSFSVENTHRFFNDIGVPLKLEETGKYFPVSDSGRKVLAALLAEVENAGAVLRTGCPVTAIKRHEELWSVRTPEGPMEAPALVVCTGGLALPKSGSDGAGLRFAQALGHTVVSTTPALSPLLANPARHAGLSGVTLAARLSLLSEGKVLVRFSGSFLFTHTGYSGPPALDLSRHYARLRLESRPAEVYLSLLPDVAPGEEARFWHEWSGRESKKSVFNALSILLPRRVAEVVLKQAGVHSDVAVGKLSPTQSAAVREQLMNMPLPVQSVAPYHKAEATAGGMSLDELQPATMESRLHPGLFMAGEICDVDGWLGGYNFQWAWSSGTVAGRAAGKFAVRHHGIEFPPESGAILPSEN